LFFFLLNLVFFDQGGARGENRRERQEKSSDHGAESACHKPGHDRDATTKQKTGFVVVPRCQTKIGGVKFDTHYGRRPKAQSPNATANHYGIALSVTNRALNWHRIMTQLTTEA